MFVLVSCSAENSVDETDLLSDDIQKTLSPRESLMKETTLLIGKLMRDPVNQGYIMDKMSVLGKNEDAVSFAYLFNAEEGLKKSELDFFQIQRKIETASPLITAIKNELGENPTEYIAILERVASTTKKKSQQRSGAVGSDNGSGDPAIEDLFVDEGLEIFFPYGQDATNNTGGPQPASADPGGSFSEYYVSYATLDGSPTNTGQYYNISDENATSTIVMDNDFIDSPPTFIIAPVDPCDLPCGPCQYVELLPASIDLETGQVYDDSVVKTTRASSNCSGGGKGGPQAVTPPTPLPSGSKTLLTYNVDHTSISQNDVLESQIPKIQVNGTDYMGFGGSNQKLIFFAASSAGAALNASGQITVSGAKAEINKVKIKRRYIAKKKNRRYIEVNMQFDPDWNVTEAEQVLVVLSGHNFSSDSETEVTAQSTWKRASDGTLDYSFDGPKTVVKNKIEADRAKYRSSLQLARKEVLANIVGGSTFNGFRTAEHDGIQYSLRRMGIIDFYLRHEHTDID